MSGAGRPSIAETVQTTDGFLRHAGREFLVVLYTAFRSLKLYPLENAQVQRPSTISRRPPGTCWASRRNWSSASRASSSS